MSRPSKPMPPLFTMAPSMSPPPTSPISTSAGTPAGRPTITVVPADYHNPYTLNWNVSIQRAVKKNYMVELSYVGMHNIGFSGNYNWNSRPWGTGLDANGKVIDLSLPENWAYRSSWVNNTNAVTGTQAYKVFPNLGGVNYQCNCVRMIYHSGTIKVEKRYSSGLSFLTFATWQKGIQNAPGNLYQDDNLMRAVTGLTQKYRYVSSMTYEMPFGKGKKWMNHNRLLDDVLGVRGRLCLVAIHPQPREINLHRFFWRELHLVGARVYQRQDFERAVDLIADGAIPAPALITEILPLGRVADAFAALEAGGPVVKLLLDCQETAP